MSKMKTAVSSLCFLLVLCIVLSTVSGIFDRKGSEKYFSEFWDNPKEYDVWFMGSSHVYCSILPMDLWEQYGIRSYNLGASGSSLTQTYWTLMCALEQSQPEVLVVDIYHAELDSKHEDGKSDLVHTGFDRIPFSAVKVRGVCDIFDTWEERIEYLWKFSLYHNRWEELEESDFHVQRCETKGARLWNGIKDNSDFYGIPKEEMSDGDTLGFLYLRKIIEECQRRGIDLVLTRIPFCSKKEEVQRAMNFVPKVAEEYGVAFLNMQYEENLLEYGTDFSNKTHVNILGARKITRYVGDYLSEHFRLTDYRQYEEVSERWEDDYESYLRLRLDEMRKAKKITSYVQWLADDRYTCYMYKGKEPEGVLAKEIAQLKNLTYISLEEAEDRMGGKIKGDYALFVEGSKGEVLDKAVFNKGKRYTEH